MTIKEEIKTVVDRYCEIVVVDDPKLGKVKIKKFDTKKKSSSLISDLESLFIRRVKQDLELASKYKKNGIEDLFKGLLN